MSAEGGKDSPQETASQVEGSICKAPPKMRELKLNMAEDRRPNGWGRSMGIQALVKNEKMPGHNVVYVIPGISIFENIQRFGVGQRETVSFIISVPANSQTRRQRVKK